MKRVPYFILRVILLCFFFAPIFSHAALINRAATDRVTNGLIGYWTFDGSSVSPNIRDSSRQGNNGFLQNFAATSTVLRPGTIGQAIQLDGVDDRINVSGVASTLATGDVSVSVWFKPNGTAFHTAGTGYFFALADAPSANDFKLGVAVNDKVGLITGSNQLLSANAISWSTTHWYHIVGIFSTTAGTKLYLDNVLMASDPSQTSRSGTASQLAYLGDQFNGAFPTGVSMDDVRVYNRALSVSEVNALYDQGSSFHQNSTDANRHLNNDLIGWWTFDGSQLTTSTAYDKSGYGNNGTLNGFTITRSSMIPGKQGQALVFDGIDDNISLGAVDHASTITLTAWVNPALNKTNMRIISKKMTGSGAEYGLSTDSSQNDKFRASFFSSLASTDTCVSTGSNGSYAPNKWYFVAAVYDGNTCAIYVNAVDVTTVTSDTAAGDLTDSGSILRIGAEGGASASNYFGGTIDDPRIYDRALSATEIASLYNTGEHAATSKNDRLTSGLLGLWSFDGPTMFRNVGDSSGQGNNGYLRNFTATSSALTPGKIGQALACDGADDRVLLNGVTLSSTYTISLWIRPNPSSKSFETLFTSNGGTSGLFFGGAAQKINNWFSSTNHLNNSTIPYNAWTHVVVVSNAGSFTFYINGASDGTGSGAPGFTAINICDDGSSEQFSGKIDDIRVYNRALSTSEVQTLYNLGR